MLTHVFVLSLAHRTALTRREVGSPRLPSFTAEVDPEDESPIAALRAALLTQLGLDAPILELYRPGESAQEEPSSSLLVIEPIAVDRLLPVAHEWSSVHDVDLAAIPEVVRARAVQWLNEATGISPVPALRAAWSRPGWQARATQWIDEALATVGRARSAPVEQMRLWGISTLLRAPTRQGNVWLKAAYPPFAAEPRTTRLVAQWFPDRVPRIVATNDAEGWTLLDDFGTSLVGEDRHGAVGTAAIGSLVSMQKGFASAIDALLDGGAVSRPLARLPDQLADAFGHPIGPTPWRQHADQRRALVGRLRRAVDRVERLVVPDSLVHGDFHSWNVADVGGRPLIFDWTDTAVGNPLVDFATWVGWVKDPRERQELFEPWVAAWSPVVPEAALRERYDDVLAIGAAYQVASYVGIVRTLEPMLGSQVSGGAVSFANLIEEALSSEP
jgi:Phosphotransferase enzyme family